MVDSGGLSLVLFHPVPLSVNFGATTEPAKLGFLNSVKLNYLTCSFNELRICYVYHQSLLES